MRRENVNEECKAERGTDFEVPLNGEVFVVAFEKLDLSK